MSPMKCLLVGSMTIGIVSCWGQCLYCLHLSPAPDIMPDMVQGLHKYLSNERMNEKQDVVQSFPV